MNINWADVLNGLWVSGLGLLGDFSVLVVFYFIIVFLDHIKVKTDDTTIDESKQ